MSSEQKSKVVELCKAESGAWAVKSADTEAAGTIPMDVSGQLETLTCAAVKYLDSNQEDECWSGDLHISSCQRVMALGWEVQVVPMVPISLGHMRDTVNVDSQGQM
jgi:hypothetical protein